MRIFLTGATGAVGRFLVPRLLEAGHDVVGMSHRADGVERLRAQGVAGVRVDAFDRDGVIRAVADAAPDAVIDQLTALGRGDRVENARMRSHGTPNVVEAAKRAGVGRIVVQSIAFAYEPGDAPADERTPLHVEAPAPRAETIAGVRAAERAAAEIDAHVILRYGDFYGPGTWYAPNGHVAGQLRAGEIRADDGVTSFVHVDDAARAAVLALDWPSGPVNIVDDEPAPAREWVPVLARVVDAPAPEPTSGRAGWERGADNALARTERGWEPLYPTWRTGLGR